MKLKIIFLAVVSALIVTLTYKFAYQSNEFDKLRDHFKGKFENIENQIIEIWDSNGSKISGESIKYNNRIQLEKLSILELEDDIYFAAKPRKSKRYTFFKLIESGNSDFIFENKSHDFPQYISYSFVSDTLITKVWNESHTISDILRKK